MTTLNERSKSVLGRIINEEQVGLELHAANRMSSFHLNVDRLVGELRSLRDCRSYLVGEGLEVGAPTGRRSQDASKARTNLRSTATRLEKSGLNAEELISAVDGDAARQAVVAAENLCDSLLKLIEKCLDAERERLAPEEAYDDLPDVPGNTRLVLSLEQAKAKLTSPVSLTAGGFFKSISRSFCTKSTTLARRPSFSSGTRACKIVFSRTASGNRSQ